MITENKKEKSNIIFIEFAHFQKEKRLIQVGLKQKLSKLNN